MLLLIQGLVGGGSSSRVCFPPPTPPPHLSELPTHLRETDADPFRCVSWIAGCSYATGIRCGPEGGSLHPPPFLHGALWLHCPRPSGFLPSLDQSDLQGSRSHPCCPSLVQLCQVVQVCRLFDDIIHLKESKIHGINKRTQQQQ